jgi:glycosyltransferase involved in cell wall biosynthesis
VRFVVAQNGARRGYAVPALLARAGMLERLYTDAAGNVGWGRWIAAAAVLPGVSGGISRLAGRRVPPEVRPFSYTFLSPHLAAIGSRLRLHRDQTNEVRSQVELSIRLSRKAMACGFGNATHLYTMLTEFPELMFAARDRGLTVISEVYILISTERKLDAERRRFPGWEPETVCVASIRRDLFTRDPLFGAVDIYLCPSEPVVEDLVKTWGIKREQTLLVPYGVDPKWLEIVNQPVPGRILFAGTAGLRKGIHYLAMAAEKLHNKGLAYEFRVAGEVTQSVARQPVCRHLEFLGRLSKHQMHDEFRQADVFVLPSLAEGSAEVTYEALAAGLPVITTPAAGSVVRDRIDGQIIPDRDPEALAAAIEETVEDRDQRDRLASSARARAYEYTWDRYGERLLFALTKLRK